MSGVAEAPLCEGKDFRWADGEHERSSGVVFKAVLTDLVIPSSVPLARPGCGKPLELPCVGDAGRLALDNHVEAALPVVGASGQGDVRVAGEVARLLLAGAGSEVQRVVEPDGDQRSDVRPAVCADGRDPEDLGVVDRLKRGLPTGGVSSWLAEARVELCAGCRRHGVPSWVGGWRGGLGDDVVQS